MGKYGPFTGGEGGEKRDHYGWAPMEGAKHYYRLGVEAIARVETSTIRSGHFVGIPDFVSACIDYGYAAAFLETAERGVQAGSSNETELSMMYREMTELRKRIRKMEEELIAR